MRLHDRQWTCTDCEDADCLTVGHVKVVSIVIPDRKAHTMWLSQSGWSCLDCGQLGWSTKNCVPA